MGTGDGSGDGGEDTVASSTAPLRASASAPGAPADSQLGLAESQWLARFDGTGRTLPDDFDTRVSFLATSQLEARARNPLFERAVFCFRYKNAKMMQALRAVLVDVNRRALPGCSVRSYQLTPEQAAAADNGELDIITGFQVVDDAFRLVVMEGLGASAMKELRARMPREAANHPRCKIFTNPGLRFKKRLYTPFHVDLKIIHLRESLPAIVRSPEIYNRVKVSEDCFEALHCLSEIRSANRLKELMTARVFPTPNQLVRLESKYGEAVSTEDIEGVPKRDTQSRGRRRRSMGQGLTYEEEQAQKRQAQAVAAALRREQNRAKSKLTYRTKAATDSWNPEFVKAKAGWRATDYLAENAATRRAVVASALRRRAERDAEPLDPRGLHNGEVYIYSGQKMQFIEWEKEELRKRLAKDKKATYTYSEEYQSLAVCLVNEEKMVEKAKQDSKAKFTTKRGFVYPAPRKPEEYSKHPKQVSESRRADLEAPWIENLFHPKPLARGGGLDDLGGKPDFDSIPTQGVGLFGGYNADGTKNPAWGKSVHLMTEDEAAEAEYERKVKAKEEWASKVVVDNVRLNPHYGVRGDKPSQLNKLQDILEGKAKHKGIRIVQNSRLPSGRPVPLRAPPATIFADDDYEDPVDFTTTLKPNIVADMYGTNAAGEPIDFVRHIHRDEMKPRAQRIKYTRKIHGMSNAEKSGPKWTPVVRTNLAPKRRPRGELVK